MHQQAIPLWQRLLPWLAVLIMLAVRSRRPQRMHVRRLWIWPIVVIVMACLAVYVEQIVQPAPVVQIVLAVLAGGAVGAPLGMLRGAHADLRLGDRPGVFYLGSTWTTIAVILGAFALRYAARSFVPADSTLGALVGDGALGFAMGFIITSSLSIYRKYEAALRGCTPPSESPAEPAAG